MYQSQSQVEAKRQDKTAKSVVQAKHHSAAKQSSSAYQLMPNHSVSGQRIGGSIWNSHLHSRPLSLQRNVVMDQRNEPLQLMKISNNIDPNKLNMVGEDHDVSGQRREQEKMYTKNIFNGYGYYFQEHAFSWLNDNNEIINGDDWYLRFKQSISFCLSFWLDGNYKEAAKHIAKAQIEYDYMNTKQNKTAHGLKNLLPEKELSEHFGKMGDSEEKIERHPDFKKPAIKIMLNRYLQDKGYKHDETSTSMINIINIIAVDRSHYMHNIASKAVGRKGIWKVGDTHVEHIKENNGLQGDYQLVEEADFDALLKKKYPGIVTQARYEAL